MSHPVSHADELIDIAELKAQSGEASFAKGVQLVSQGRVQQLRQNGKRITARVQGSHRYRVRLENGHELVSYCNCPAASYQALCKHGVATALAFNRQLTALDGEEGALAQVPDERARLHGYFDRQEKPALLDVLLDELSHNSKRWHYWLRKVDLSEQALSPAKLKTLINKALPRQNIWGWQEVNDYFTEATEQFEEIWEAVDALPLEQQWLLTHHALKRLNTVLQQIDDSSGDRFELEADICERLPALFALLPWSENDKVSWLFTHLVEQPMEVFPREEGFGALAQSPAFLALCEQGLERTLTQVEQDHEHDWDLLRYAHPLLEAARACGDWRRELKLLASMASCTRSWLQLCKLCCEHQEPLEGEYWLTKARKGAISPHEQDACDEAEVTLCVALGEKGRAWRLARACFERFPNVEGFTHLRQLQQQLAWQDETLLPWVEERFKGLAAINQPFDSSFHQDALIRFYLDLDRVQDACDWVAHHKISPELLVTLAERVAPDHPELAMTYLFRVAAGYVATGNSGGYEKAVAVLSKLEQSLGDDETRQASFSQQLKTLATENKRKRSFIQLMNQYFTSYL